MVHPHMRQSTHATTETVEGISKKVIDMLDRLHVLVIGPGLGRDPLMQETCARLIRAARGRGMPFVLDAVCRLGLATNVSIGLLATNKVQ